MSPRRLHHSATRARPPGVRAQAPDHVGGQVALEGVPVSPEGVPEQQAELRQVVVRSGRFYRSEHVQRHLPLALPGTRPGHHEAPVGGAQLDVRTLHDRHAFLDPAVVQEDPGDPEVPQGFPRIDGHHGVGVDQRLGVSPDAGVEVGQPLVGPEVTGLRRLGLLEVAEGRSGAPSNDPDHGQRQMGLGESGVSVEGPSGPGFGLVVLLVLAEPSMAAWQWSSARPAMTCGLSPMRFSPAFQSRDGLPETLGAVVPHQVPGLEPVLVDLGVRDGTPGQTRLLRRTETDPEGLHDGPGDLLLDVEHVVQRSAVLLGPEVRIRGGIDQLSGDAKAVPRPSHAALHHVAHLELRGDLG